MNRLYAMLLGAGLMYFYDPERGKRRRSLARDRIIRMRHDLRSGVNAGVSDLQNKTYGVLSQAASKVKNEPVSDWVLAERARSRLGYLTPHPRAIEINVQDGVLHLAGDAIEYEVESILTGLGKVPGIRTIENRLTTHAEPGDISGLQGEGYQMQTGQWSPGGRLLAGVGSGYLLMRGRKGGLFGWLVSLGGLALGIRALSNQGVGQFLGLSQSKESIRVTKTIEVNVPVDDVYAIWSNFETFSQFMAHVREIQTNPEGVSHWVVAGPAGIPVEFDTTITEDRPNEFIAWETLPESSVRHNGQVRFRENSSGGTQINVRLNYTPPAGAIGHAVAALFGTDPKQAMDDDLARLKSLLEHGKTTADGTTVRQEEINSA